MSAPRQCGVGSRYTMSIAPIGAASGRCCMNRITAARPVGRLGFSAADVTHVIPTHPGLGHAGGLPDLPNATVHILTRERDAALAPAGFRQRERDRACHFDHQPKWKTYDVTSGEAWDGFDRVRQLAGLPPEILLIALPGHSP